MTPPTPASDGGWTKGPLAVHPLKAWIVCQQLDGDGEPCPVAALAWPTKYRSEAETLANGQLYAAAPDLYDALFALWSVCVSERFEPDPGKPGMVRDGVYDKRVEEARAALSRARGEA